MHGTAFKRLSPKTEKSFKRKTVTTEKTQGHKHFPRTPRNEEWNVFAKLRRHQLELQVSTKHLPADQKTHTHLLFPLYKRRPNDHPVNKARDSSRTPERRSHRPKVDTGQTEGRRSIEELAGGKGGCEVSLTKTQPTPTKNPTRTTPPTRVVRTKHPTPHILPVMNARDSIRTS